ncbi:MAG: response regulator [Candidatus Lokiarchaeota archaeon]|nr:response regulator [Candidatus Lokiarchaeota archaeon]
MTLNEPGLKENLKNLILLVEDDNDILLLTKKTLEIAKYDVVTAKNGIDALKILDSLEDKVPDLIISDILMPGMDGYEFFKAVSENPKWNQIPFVFLTALSTPEDVRLGKLLGVDDYLSKPVKREDLYAIVSGRIARSKKIQSVNKKVKEMIQSFNIDITPSILEDEKDLITLLFVAWHDYIGPELKAYHPKKYKLPMKLSNIGTQLFQATVSMYGHEHITKSEGILLNIENIQRNGYLFFDAYPDETSRGGEKQYMLAVIAPKINYFESLQIREVLKKISIEVKKKQEWEISSYWEEIANILTTPAI